GAESGRRPPGAAAAPGGAGSGGPAWRHGGCRSAARGRAGPPGPSAAGGGGRGLPARAGGRPRGWAGPARGGGGGGAGPPRGAEVALDRGAGDAGRAGDVVVSQPLGLQPEDFQLALDEGLGVVIALEGDGRQVVLGERDARHGRILAWWQLLFGRRSTQAEGTGKCLKLCRREYNGAIYRWDTTTGKALTPEAGDSGVDLTLVSAAG